MQCLVLSRQGGQQITNSILTFKIKLVFNKENFIHFYHFSSSSSQGYSYPHKKRDCIVMWKNKTVIMYSPLSVGLSVLTNIFQLSSYVYYCTFYH